MKCTFNVKPLNCTRKCLPQLRMASTFFLSMRSGSMSLVLPSTLRTTLPRNFATSSQRMTMVGPSGMPGFLRVADEPLLAHAESEADARSDGRALLGNAVVVVLLRFVVHQQQAAGLQIEFELRTRGLAGDAHAPGR